ncbi:MAG: hypothetical protein Q8R39_02910 [bacterium]|nr:hypothetical protein [bacterium]MDZ4284505.1 hypothetical protein [Patescibacteria group bacterium]
MKKLLERIRGTEDSEEFYFNLGCFIVLLLMSLAAIIFGRGEQKLAGVFGIILALMIGLPRSCRKKV